MQVSVIQKIIFNEKAFVERRLPEADEGRFFVEKGSKVRPFDFVAEIKDTARQWLTAGVGGEVVKILPQKAILIRTSAVVIRGVFGRGEDSEGEIKIAAEHDEPLCLEAVEADGRDQILVGGSVPTLEVFKKAEAVGVKGIVCGGADFASLQKTTLPTLITEGFGRPPLNYRIFEFLKNVEGRHVFLSPEREELLVARHINGKEDQQELIEAESKELSEAFVELKEGMEVEIFGSNHFGQIGKVGKVGADVVEVLLEKGDKIEVPGRNLGVVK